MSSATAPMQAGDYAAAFEIAELVDLDDFRSDLDEPAVIILLRQGEIELVLARLAPDALRCGLNALAAEAADARQIAEPAALLPQ